MWADIIAAFFVAAAVGHMQVTDVPFSIVVHQQIEPGRWGLQLTNTGDKPVVAWSFQIVDANGHRYGSTRDALQLLGDRRGNEILQPGVPTVVDYRTAARLDGATITPRAVVYADATAIGDAEAIDHIFAARRAKADALADLIPKLDALAQTGFTVESLTAASVALGDPTRKTRGSLEYQALAQNLMLVAKSPTPEFGFHDMLERMRREWQLANEHSVRRP
jgi:hypothetical protein